MHRNQSIRRPDEDGQVDAAHWEAKAAEKTQRDEP